MPQIAIIRAVFFLIVEDGWSTGPSLVSEESISQGQVCVKLVVEESRWVR
jgi:hypothetical protein